MRYHELTGKSGVLTPPEVLPYLVGEGSFAFVSLSPKMTGLSRTLWVSEDTSCPYVVVSRTPDVYARPTPRDEVVAIRDGNSEYTDVDQWINSHREDILALGKGEIDSIDFVNAVGPYTHTLVEMVSVPPRLTRLPMVIFCSPDVASHDVRIKVSPIHGDRKPNGNLVTIALRPTIHYPKDEKARLSRQDFEVVSAWATQHIQAIMDYWDHKIDTQTFLQSIGSARE